MNAARWHQLPKRIQLLSIMAELERARTWEAERGSEFTGALKRALDLVGFTFADPRWKDELSQLSGLQDEITLRYNGTSNESVAILSRAL